MFVRSETRNVRHAIAPPTRRTATTATRTAAAEERLLMKGKGHYCPTMIFHKVLARATACAAVLWAIALPAAGEPLVPLPAQPSGVPWPTKDWPRGPLPSAQSAAALDKLLSVVGQKHPLLGETRAVVI